MRVEHTVSGLIVRKSCSAGGFLLSSLCLLSALWIFILLFKYPPAVDVLLPGSIGVLIAILVAVIAAECIWMRVEVDGSDREIRLHWFGYLRRRLDFDEIADIVASYDEGGVLVPVIRLKTGRKVFILAIQARTDRRKAEDIQHAVSEMRAALSQPG